MYKILIADDEGIVIDSLKFIIDKNFAGQCQVEAAKSGRAVIELAERFRPDIAFMDIHMGGINGIDAMKEIRKVNTYTIFIVITAYDKFDYAKEAINLGVMEYMNKPIEQKKIVDVLTRAMGVIDEQRKRRSMELEIREKLEVVVPVLENGLLNEILFQEHFEDDVVHFKKLLSIKFDYGYVAVLVFGDEQEGNRMTNAAGATIHIHEHYEDVREIIKEHFAGIISSVMSNKIVVYVPVNAQKLDYGQRIDIIEKARKMILSLSEQIQIHFRIGIGAVYKLQNARKSYSEALSALTLSDGAVAHVKDLPIGCEYEESYPVNLEQSLFAAVKRGDVLACQEYADQFYQWMKDQYPMDMEDVKLKVLEFVLYAEHISYESGGMVYRFSSRKQYLPTISKIQDTASLKQWFLAKMLEACRNITVKKEERSNSLVNRAKDYMDTTYQKDISLDDVSRELDISPYYFSKLFKEETGTNFIEYLTNIRIKKAKQLLVEGRLNVREICSEVGYQDPNYFSRLFKKNVGVTPTEFKEGVISGQE